MKNVIMLAIAALVATPAIAADATNFTGIRASVAASEGNREDNVGYLGTVGFDQTIAPSTTLGFEVSAQDVFEREDLSVGARLGYALTPNVLAFASGGVAEVEGNFGYRAGGGVEFALGRNAFTTVEYRYTDLGNELNRSQGLVGLGLRF